MTRKLLRDRRLATTSVVLALFLADRLVAGLTGGEGWIPSLGGGAMVLAWGMGHCDTLDGPVVKLAQRALESGDVNLVLPWVPEKDEATIRDTFSHALAVRKLGGEAAALADRHFLETLVRVHRAAEGAAFTGLKPAGQDLGPAVPAADRALQTGSADDVVKLLTDAVRKGVQRHFQHAMQRRDFDADDVKAGRAYVHAYVPYVHYVERLWQAASGEAHGHHPAH